MKKHGDKNRMNWIQFLEKRISVLVVTGASGRKIEALTGNLKRLKNEQKKLDRKYT